jgi:hypothetical protein
MNTPSEPVSNVPVDEKSHWWRWRPPGWPTVFAVVVVAVVVVAFAVIAGFLANANPGSDWIPVYQDVLKTSFGALAVGGLGGLAKLIFDQRRAEQDRVDKLRDRVGYISTLNKVGQDIDTTRVVMLTSRSVKLWTHMVNDRVIPARSRLNDMAHQLTNWAAAGLPVFDDTPGLIDELEGMDYYLKSLLDEYGENKQAFDELQLRAEGVETTRPEAREQLLNQIWERMSGLPLLGDLIRHDQKYIAYRKDYLTALLKMRQSLVT